MNQWIWFDFFSTVECNTNINNETRIDYSPLNSRYDDQIAIYGREAQEKLSKLNLTVLGACGLGTEILKNLALMGVSTTKGSRCLILDNSKIEENNISRLIYAQEKDLGTPKSSTVIKIIQSLNDQIKLEEHNKLDITSEDIKQSDLVINSIFTTKFKKQITINCIDEERNLLDLTCEGLKGRVKIMIPKVTKQLLFDDEEETENENFSISNWTNFPTDNKECIIWAKNVFYSNFNFSIMDLKKIMTNFNLPEFLESISNKDIVYQVEKLAVLKSILTILTTKKFEYCVEYAYKTFVECFDHSVQNIFFNFPMDHKLKDGSKFWAHQRLTPSTIPFDYKDDIHVEFIRTFTLLISKSLGIEMKSKEEIVNIIHGLKYPSFVPKKFKFPGHSSFLFSSNIDKLNSEVIKHDSKIKLENLMSSLEPLLQKFEEKININDIQPNTFEKNNLIYEAIEFINITANLRAKNYKLKEVININ